MPQAIRSIRKYMSVTAVLVAVNILLFAPQLVSQRLDAMLYEAGALNPTLVLQGGEYYRILTAMFLHADVNHLASNMIILYFVGVQVEKRLGRISYFLLYLLSGVIGNMVSIALQQMHGESFYSIGASGAVFGVVGAMAAIMIRNRKYIRRSDMTRMLIGVGYSIYLGFQSRSTDNAAHIGGFIAGVIIAGALSLFGI
ncbi:MAG: rhomboid family intramembrane serine protease [Lachnospiraceae bacterium]|nr:rhomboid family intramembrane serine protease [Lachnospiraceae bacterium]